MGKIMPDESILKESVYWVMLSAIRNFELKREIYIMRKMNDCLGRTERKQSCSSIRRPDVHSTVISDVPVMADIYF